MQATSGNRSSPGKRRSPNSQSISRAPGMLDLNFQLQVAFHPNTAWEVAMSWKAPKVVEVALGAEINSYACAGLKK